MQTHLRQGNQNSTIAVLAGSRKVRRRFEEWVWVFQEHLRALALDRRMTGSHWRVLAYIVSYATFAQDVTLKQKDVATAMGIAFQTVSRVLGDLDTIGILKRVETHAYPPTYRFNSQYIYKGQWERLRERRAYQEKGGCS